MDLLASEVLQFIFMYCRFTYWLITFTNHFLLGKIDEVSFYPLFFHSFKLVLSGFAYVTVFQKPFGTPCS